jgi:hypothetical protein
MPTGYTSDIEKGISFKEYALKCARAFLVTMRDASENDEIPDTLSQEFSYHEDKISKIKKEIKHIKKMNYVRCDKRSKKEHDNNLEYYLKQIKERNDLKLKYESMLKQVREYIAPTTKHIEYKNFMESQIVSSIKWDCDIDYYENYIKKLVLLNSEDWKKEKLKSLFDDLEYHEEEYAKEQERKIQYEDWVKNLKVSLENHESVRKMKTFELELEGFDGSNSRTDNLIKWVNAESQECLEKWLKNNPFGIPVEDFNQIDSLEIEDGVDIVLETVNSLISGKMVIIKESGPNAFNIAPKKYN